MKMINRENNILNGAIGATIGRLPAWEITVKREAPGPGGVLDAVVELRRRGSTARPSFGVEVRNTPSPQELLQLVPRLVKTSSATRRPLAPMVVATFLSRRSQQLLEGAGISYADSTGNARIVSGDVYIRLSGSEKNPAPKKQPLMSLKGAASGRLVRALCDFLPPYNLSRLATMAKTSLGTTSKVLRLLESEALITRESRGDVLEVKWRELLERWTQDYRLMTSNMVKPYVAPRGIPDLLRRLREYQGQAALTGSIARFPARGSANVRQVAIFVDDLTNAARALDLEPEETGTNALLVGPFDEVVFARASLVDGLPCAAPTQVAADLLSGPGRGPSEAELHLNYMEGHPDAWRSRSAD